MNNDIAVVKIEDGFDFSRRVRGCEFIPKPVCYNNQSHTLENPGTVATIAGWGTTSKYNDVSQVDILFLVLIPWYCYCRPDMGTKLEA